MAKTHDADVTLPSAELNAFDLPRLCVITGEAQGVDFKPVKFQWYPPWINLFILVGWPVALVLMLVMRQRVQGQLPFTEVGWARWQRAKVLSVVGGLGGLALIFGGIIVGATNDSGALTLLGVAAGLAAVVAASRNLAKNSPVVRRIADGRITLRLPSPGAARALQQHLVAGARIPAPAAAARVA